MDLALPQTFKSRFKCLFCKIYFSPAAVHSLDVVVMGQKFHGRKSDWIIRIALSGF